MKPKEKHSYELSKEYLAGLHNQEYARRAPKNKPYQDLNGALQRMVTDEAIISVEGLKLSQTNGDFVKEHEGLFYEKFTELYAQQAKKNPERFFEREAELMRVYLFERDRDAARGNAIIARAKMIDKSAYKESSTNLLAQLSVKESTK